MRLIDADALMEIYMDRLSLVADRYSPDSSECGILTGAMKLLDEQPTIEPERKTGEWISKGYGEYRCSSCREIVDLDEEILMSIKSFNYCPCCGSYNGR